jgi:ATP-dependent helicase HrpA
MSTGAVRAGDVQERLDALTVRDARRLARRARELRDPARLEQEVAAAEERVARRRAAVPTRIVYPETLPVSERREDIAAAISGAQVVVIAGETGSGKTTQIPKICLELGRGVRGLIGHTQPRRLAARSVAERIAEELEVPLGSTVGYTVRFHDQVGEDTLVKLMTDGVLLAEMPATATCSPTTRSSSTRRTSGRSTSTSCSATSSSCCAAARPQARHHVATIDPQRFAEHFDGRPCWRCPGRSFPVEVRYRPIVDEDVDQVQAVVQASTSCPARARATCWSSCPASARSATPPTR